MAAGKALMLAALAAAGVLGGAAAAGFMGAPLGFLSFHINGTGVNATWIPVYIDLGTINENQTVNASGTATITLPRGGAYVINIVAPEKYARIFKYFHVKVVIDGNKTVELALRHPAEKVRLAAGEHTVNVYLEAQTRAHLPSITVEHAPFLAIHPLGNAHHQGAHNHQPHQPGPGHAPWG